MAPAWLRRRTSTVAGAQAPLGGADRSIGFLWAFHVNACSPADDHAFDALARFRIPPIPATPSTWEGKQIRADVILAKQLERPIRRRFAFVSERIHALLPRCHRLDSVFAVLGSGQPVFSESAASLANRSALSRAVFSRTARASDS
jgi:hypothetical protein